MLSRLLGSTIGRAARFYNFGSTSWLLLPAIAIVGGLLRVKSVSLLWSLGLLLAGFLLGRLAATFIVRRIKLLGRPLIYGQFVPVVLGLLLRIAGYSDTAILVLCASAGLWFGCAFWVVTDPMYDMVQWLVFPTELGRPPDEIYLFDRRWMAWDKDDAPQECRLYRFSHDDRWSYGLWGPLTFSMFEDFEGLTAEQIYGRYGAWYHENDMGERLHRAAEDDFNE